MTKFYLFSVNFILSLGILVGSANAQASQWHEFGVHEGHAYYNNGKAFKARVSFTVERTTPTIGLEQGANYAGKLFVELYTMDNLGHCPEVALAQKLNSGESLIYMVPLKYNPVEGQCSGEVSQAENQGRYSPQGNLTSYFKNPIMLTIGKVKQQHTLYVQDSASSGEFNFVLADSMN